MKKKIFYFRLKFVTYLFTIIDRQNTLTVDHRLKVNACIMRKIKNKILRAAVELFHFF
jgi:hypothetical protein